MKLRLLRCKISGQFTIAKTTLVSITQTTETLMRKGKSTHVHNGGKIVERATPQFVNLETFSLNFSKFFVCNPCQSSPSLTIIVPLRFASISLVFSYKPIRSKLLLSGFTSFCT